MNEQAQTQECCTPFDPEPWQDKEIEWQDKRFVKDRVRSFLHIPLNFGTVMRRCVARIEAAGAKAQHMIVLADESKLWSTDVYIDVTKEVPDVEMTTLSGTFLSKVFEGPYQQVRSWMREMNEHVTSQGRTAKKTYTYYTTCPVCAKKFGKNYVVLLTQV